MVYVFRPTLRLWLLLFLLLFVLSGCAAKVENRPEDVRLVTASGAAESPLFFLVSEWQQPYNRIGQVRAEQHQDYERIFVDPVQAVFYSSRFSFTTEQGNTYTNQIFRVHFAKIPFSLIPFHLGTGRNIGLLIVISRDSDNRPVLVTTVNTCGCYVAIMPTSYLPAEAYPPGWPEKEQHVYGEVLPALLEMTAPDDPLLITIRPAVHRIRDVQVVEAGSLPGVQKVSARIQPLSALKSLPIDNGQTTSMYYSRWPLSGHVKGAIKLWESLLLSIVSLDLYVGMDKEYDSTQESGNPFYTSLKPWNRNSSDMNDFAGFLQFYGWRL